MKHRWALLGTLSLSLTLVVGGVAGAAPTSGQEASERTAAPASAQVLAPTLAAGFYWQLTSAQQVEPGTVLLTRKGAHADSVGTRSDDEFFKISSTGSNDVPEAALRAYRRAAKAMATADPDCDISWTLLAAIGRVETNHGRFGGSQLGTDGVSRPEIRGPQLDGAGPFAAIRDSDNGRLDRDKVWDRAVGQMQFLPETWRSVARDGDGNGTKDPDDIDDAALGSAVYLCGAGGSLANSAGMARAAFRYNHSDYYVALVLSMQAGFETGVFTLPSPPPPPREKSSKADKARTARAKAARTAPKTTVKAKVSSVKPTTSPRPTPTPRPKPKPTPAPKPKPRPTAPAAPRLVTVAGTWTACPGGYCLDGARLDLTLLGSSFDPQPLVDREVTLQVEAQRRHVVRQVVTVATAQASPSPAP